MRRVHAVEASVAGHIYQTRAIQAIITFDMSILIAEDNVAQRAYLREILERDFPSHQPVLEAGDGEETVAMALKQAAAQLEPAHPASRKAVLISRPISWPSLPSS